MARANPRKSLRPSILDRLIDQEPHVDREATRSATQKLADLRQSVRRDLENLLNTRYRVVEPPEDLEQLNVSLLNYGLPDLATINISSVEKKREFTRDLERILREYEPRFKSVKVTPMENREATDRTLRFRIDAVLWADPAPQVVVFDSVLEPISRSVNVQESAHG